MGARLVRKSVASLGVSLVASVVGVAAHTLEARGESRKCTGQGSFRMFLHWETATVTRKQSAISVVIE